MIALILQYICALCAAVLLGRWFLSESKKLKALGKPWYAIYFKAPGIFLIVVIVFLPILAISL